MQQDQTYLDVNEGAAYIRAKPDTLRRWARKGLIDCIPMPAVGPVFTRDMLDSFMARRARAAKARNCKARRLRKAGA